MFVCLWRRSTRSLILTNNWRDDKNSPKEFQAGLMHQHAFQVSSDLSAKLMHRA